MSDERGGRQHGGKRGLRSLSLGRDFLVPAPSWVALPAGKASASAIEQGSHKGCALGRGVVVVVVVVVVVCVCVCVCVIV